MATIAEPIAWVTGERSTNRTDLNWGVGGTDLGIMWDDGQGRILAAFGDTFNPRKAEAEGGGADGGDWRNNVLACSTDWDPHSGMDLEWFVTDAPGHARQVIPKDRPEDFGIIPTGGMSAEGRHYMTYMSIHDWGEAGTWRTNHAGVAYSDDAITWYKPDEARWYNTANWGQKFQMTTLAQDGKGWVYLFGSPNGRHGHLYLARAPFWALMDLSKHRQWNGKHWVADPDQAVPIINETVSECSVAYHAYSGRWLLTYLNDPGGQIVMHDAPHPVGPWSGPRVLVESADWPGLYGAWWHPWSLSDPNPCFLMSKWAAYNTVLMRANFGTATYQPSRVIDLGARPVPYDTPAAA